VDIQKFPTVRNIPSISKHINVTMTWNTNKKQK